jgi:translation initiation factor 6
MMKLGCKNKTEGAPMSYRKDFNGSIDIGAYITLTNKYCVVGKSETAELYTFLSEHMSIPIVEATINSTRSVGCLCRGNARGLVVPDTVTDQELMHIRNSLPENIVVKRIEERLNAFGNVLLCNDEVAIVHVDLEQYTVDEIERVLGVPVFRQNIGCLPLVGTFGALNNQGMLVHPEASQESQAELSELLQVNVIAGTVNSGLPTIGGGLVVNDWLCIAGPKTTNIEMAVIESVFELAVDADAEMKKRSVIDAIVK